MKTIFWSFLMLFSTMLPSGYSAGHSPEEKKAAAESLQAFEPRNVSDTLFNFENYPVGQAPSGWTEAVTGKGKPCRWEIVNDQGNKVLAQLSSETPDYRFNLIVNNALRYKDVEITVRFKAVKGRGDQGGGPVWRYRDAGNYYVARANPLENNFRLYKVVHGSRHMLKSATLSIATGKWYTIKVIMRGNRICCYLNGQLALETTDNTFSGAGKVGLWTKSDAVTWFDDFRVAVPVNNR